MKRRIIVAALGAAALVGAYAAFGFYAVPRLVHDGVVDGLREEFGRDASLGEVRFNPFALRLVARDFEVRDEGGTRTLAFGLLDVDFELSSLWRRAWTFASIRLERPYARLIQYEDQTLNVTRLFASRGPSADAPAGETRLPRLSIRRFELDSGEFDYEDRARSAPFLAQFRPITFSLVDFTTEGSGNAFRLSATGDSGARFDFDGAFGVAPLASRGRVAIGGLPATQVAAYVGDLLPVSLIDGSIGLEIRYDVSLPPEGLRGTLEAPRAEVTNLATVAPGHEVPWRVGSIVVRDSQADLATRRARIGAVEVLAARLPVVRTSAGLQLPGLVPAANAGAAAEPAANAEAPASAAAEDPAPDATPWRVEAGPVTLRDAVLPFEDRTLEPAAALELRVPEITVGGLAWPLASPLEVTAAVVSGAGGRVRARGSVTPEPLVIDLAVELDALSLVPLQPYLSRQSDLLLDAGAVAGSLEVRLAPGTGPDAALAVTGDARLDGLRSRDRLLQQDFARWRTLEFDGIDFSSAPASLTIREVVAREPWIRLVLGVNGVTNIEAVLDPKAAALKAERIAAELAAGRKAEETPEEVETAAPPAPPAARAPGHADAHRPRPHRRRRDPFRRPHGRAELRRSHAAARRHDKRPVLGPGRAREGGHRRQGRPLRAGEDHRRRELPRRRVFHRRHGPVREHRPLHVQPLLGQVRRLHHRQGQAVGAHALPRGEPPPRCRTQDPHRPARARRQGRLARRHRPAAQARDRAAQGP
jgi:hypothetical protein